MKYNVKTTKRFDKEMIRCQKRGYNMQLIVEAIRLLEATGSLPAKYRPHKLSGKLQGIWECHKLSAETSQDDPGVFISVWSQVSSEDDTALS